MTSLRFLCGWLLAVALEATFGPAHAQQPTLTYTGRVVNAHATPLAGVSVLVKGTTTATSTNSEGRFLLAVPAGRQVLVFDYPAHLAVELPVLQPDSLLVVRLHSTQPRATPRRRP